VLGTGAFDNATDGITGYMSGLQHECKVNRTSFPGFSEDTVRVMPGYDFLITPLLLLHTITSLKVESLLVNRSFQHRSHLHGASSFCSTDHL
jgi:hypothetical protein